jgi:hypothetical protein
MSDTVTLQIEVPEPLYRLLRLEADDGMDSGDVLLKSTYANLTRYYAEEHEIEAAPPVGVTDEVAERMELLAEWRRQAGHKYPWADTVSHFITAYPEPLDEGHEEVRPEWADWP